MATDIKYGTINPIHETLANKSSNDISKEAADKLHKEITDEANERANQDNIISKRIDEITKSDSTYSKRTQFITNAEGSITGINHNSQVYFVTNNKTKDGKIKLHKYDYPTLTVETSPRNFGKNKFGQVTFKIVPNYTRDPFGQVEPKLRFSEPIDKKSVYTDNDLQNGVPSNLQVTRTITEDDKNKVMVFSITDYRVQNENICSDKVESSVGLDPYLYTFNLKKLFNSIGTAFYVIHVPGRTCETYKWNTTTNSWQSVNTSDPNEIILLTKRDTGRVFTNDRNSDTPQYISKTGNVIYSPILQNEDGTLKSDSESLKTSNELLTDRTYAFYYTETDWTTYDSAKQKAKDIVNQFKNDESNTDYIKYYELTDDYKFVNSSNSITNYDTQEKFANEWLFFMWPNELLSVNLDFIKYTFADTNNIEIIKNDIVLEDGKTYSLGIATSKKTRYTGGIGPNVPLSISI